MCARQQVRAVGVDRGEQPDRLQRQPVCHARLLPSRHADAAPRQDAQRAHVEPPASSSQAITPDRTTAHHASVCASTRRRTGARSATRSRQDARATSTITTIADRDGDHVEQEAERLALGAQRVQHRRPPASIR